MAVDYDAQWFEALFGDNDAARDRAVEKSLWLELVAETAIGKTQSELRIALLAVVKHEGRWWRPIRHPSGLRTQEMIALDEIPARIERARRAPGASRTGWREAKKVGRYNDERGVPRPTVDGWIADCRALGLLAPSVGAGRSRRGRSRYSAPSM